MLQLVVSSGNRRDLLGHFGYPARKLEVEEGECGRVARNPNSKKLRRDSPFPLIPS